MLSETEASKDSAWEAVAGGLGLLDASEGEQVETLREYFYGDTGPEAVAREEPVWREWLAEALPEADARAKRAVRSS